MSFWGRLIKQLRTEQGVTQRQLSQAARVPRPTIIRIENGDCPGFFDQMERIFSALGYELEALPVNPDTHDFGPAKLQSIEGISTTKEGFVRKIQITSFSYRRGKVSGSDWAVFDCRDLRNPHNVRELRDLNGQDPAVRKYVADSPGVQEIVAKAVSLAVKGSKSCFAFGCVGGKHRSVAIAEMLSERLDELGFDVDLRHPEITCRS